MAFRLGNGGAGGAQESGQDGPVAVALWLNVQDRFIASVTRAAISSWAFDSMISVSKTTFRFGAGGLPSVSGSRVGLILGPLPGLVAGVQQASIHAPSSGQAQRGADSSLGVGRETTDSLAGSWFLFLQISIYRGCI